jgi:proteasome lid subunit RPN8/RPN11
MKGRQIMQSKPQEASGVPQQLQLAPDVYEAIGQTIGEKPAESGGILGGQRRTGHVTHFFFDENAVDLGTGSYTPNVEELSAVIKQQWRPQGIDYVGSIHSHPACSPSPSAGDAEYARRILDALELPYLFVPIVQTVPDTGSFSLFPYLAIKAEDGVAFIEQELIVSGREIRLTRKQPVASRIGEREPAALTSQDFASATKLLRLSLIGLVVANVVLANVIMLELARELYRLELARKGVRTYAR